jgi:hypothetical protein
MDLRNSRWAPIGAAFLLFAVVDLLLLLVFPPPKGTNGAYWPVLLPPVLAGAVVLVTLPALLGLFERQQDRIERQNKQISSLHAMDTAIAAEQELEPLLAVAAHETTLAVDADQGGVYLFASDETGGAESVALHNVPDEQENPVERRRFLELLRAGASAPDADARNGAEAIRVPIESDGQVIGYLAVARWSAAGRAPFRADDFALLRDLSSTIVVAVKNANALQRARNAARVEDELARERRVVQALQAGLLSEVPARGGPYLFSKLLRGPLRRGACRRRHLRPVPARFGPLGRDDRRCERQRAGSGAQNGHGQVRPALVRAGTCLARPRRHPA